MQSVDAHTHQVLFVVVASVLVSFVLMLVAGKSPRGTDQFWYVADVESLNDGSFNTNNVYPATVESSDLPARFVHNNLALYVVAPVARVFGPQRGWLLMNWFVSCLTALVVFLLCRAVCGREISAIAAAIYLLLPVTVWQYCNALSESICAAATAFAAYFYVSAKSVPRLLIASIFVAAAALVKQNLLGLFIIFPVLQYVDSGDKPREFLQKHWIWLLETTALLAACVLLRKFCFKENIDYTLAGRLMTSVPPTYDTMLPYFTLGDLHINWVAVWWKMVRNLKETLWSGPVFQMFFLPFNIMLVCAICCYRNDKHGRLATTAVGLAVLYLATILCFQTEFRYTLLFTAPMFCCAVVWISQKITLRGLVYAIIAAEIVIGSVLALRIRREGELRAAETSEISDFLSRHAGKAEPIVFERDPGDPHRMIEFAYATRPRLVLFVEPGETGCRQYARLREKVNPRLALLKSDQSKGFFGTWIPTGPLPASYSGYKLYELGSNTCLQP